MVQRATKMETLEQVDYRYVCRVEGAGSNVCQGKRKFLEIATTYYVGYTRRLRTERGSVKRWEQSGSGPTKARNAITNHLTGKYLKYCEGWRQLDVIEQVCQTTQQMMRDDYPHCTHPEPR